MSGKRYVTLTLKDKLKILSEAKCKQKSELCKKYGCSLNTLNRILRNESEIKSKASKWKLSSKRVRNGNNIDVERALQIWFEQMQSSGAVISTHMLMEKAEQLAQQMNCDFTPSTGWLWRWQQRQGIKLRKIHGEQKSADSNAAEDFLSSVVPNIISEYEEADIFNADESALFFKALPPKSLCKQGYRNTGFKSSKERVTLLFICNATGNYKKVIVIGKAKNPRCLKSKVSPLKYYSNQKAWMTADLWSEIILNLEEEMASQKRNIVLFVDNASCHKKPQNLKHINIQFLPANTTAISQPLDQGIIHAFKSYYRQNIVRKQIVAMELGKTVEEFSKSINILQAMHMIKRSFWMVKPTSIKNCFKKAKLMKTSPEEENEETESSDEFEIADNLREEFEKFVTCDDNVECNGVLTDMEIIKNILDSAEDEDEEQEHDNLKPPSVLEALKYIQELQTFFCTENKFLCELGNMESYILSNKLKNTQTKITDFFK
uniref:HTH CENPB-type domain-containing protein n=1 Tax=Musca domestica TaxID=7370 RepID=A0A1I8M6K0_MUSDO